MSIINSSWLPITVVQGGSKDVSGYVHLDWVEFEKVDTGTPETFATIPLPEANLTNEQWLMLAYLLRNTASAIEGAINEQ